MNAGLISFARTAAAACVLLGALSACSVLPPRPGNPQYAPVKPAPEHNVATNGAIYDAAQVTPLFADVRARHVGDNLTVILAEHTDAKKSADTSTSRNSSVAIKPPKVFGRNVTVAGAPVLQTSVNGKDAFSGKGDTSQSNQLTGAITVTVARVLSNGNLVVQGEKWIDINQSREFVRVRGIVRPTDIASDDSVRSTQLANARISYGGTGTLNDANRPGWLMRLFQSVFWPI